MRLAIKDDVSLALVTLARSKFRTFLTMLGIIIGVFSVLIVFAIGQGIGQSLESQVSQLSDDSILIKPINSSSKDGLLVGNNAGGNLLSSDIASLRKIPEISSIVPLSVVNSSVSVDLKKYEVPIWATTEDFPDLYQKKIAYGSFFSDNSSLRSVVIGKSTADKLFDEPAPIGQELSILGEQYVVSGVLDEIPAVPFIQDIDFNESIIAPYGYLSEKTNNAIPPFQIAISSDSTPTTPLLAKITEILAKDRGGLQNFEVLTSDQAKSQSSAAFSTIIVSIIIVGIISLLVGGVGIMNVLFASVNERIKEIGLRKAIGATNKQILRQFMTEAIVVSVLGAFIGIVLAYIASLLVSIYTNLELQIDINIVGAVLLCTIVVGGFFGSLPAVKASRKDPIEALRHE